MDNKLSYCKREDIPRLTVPFKEYLKKNIPMPIYELKESSYQLTSRNCYRKLGAFEDLVDQGRLVILPHGIGQEVFVVDTTCEHDLSRCEYVSAFCTSELCEKPCKYFSYKYRKEKFSYQLFLQVMNQHAFVFTKEDDADAFCKLHNGLM